MHPKKILGIYGAGNLGREVLELVNDINNISRKWEKFVYIVDNTDEKEKNGIEILTPEEFSELKEPKEVVIAVGEPFARNAMKRKVQELNMQLAPPLFHPSVKIVSDAKIGRGTIVGYSSFISFDAHIGENVCIQPGCGIGHNVSIGNNCVISAGTRVAGHVNIGENTYVGLMVPIRDRVSIGSGCIVSMGSVVQRNITDNMIAMGNPARPIKPNNEHKLF